MTLHVLPLQQRDQRSPEQAATGGTALGVGAARRIAVTLLMVILTSVLAAATLHLFRIGASPWQVTGGSAAMLGMYVSQAFICMQPQRLRSERRLRYGLITAQTVLAYAPFIFLGQSWVGLASLLGATMLLSLRSPWSWLMAAAVVGTVLYASLLWETPWVEVAYNCVSTIMVGAAVYALSLLVEMVVRLQAAQAELSRIAVEQERLRFSRDLHDLLGISLSAITLRSELSQRLVDAQPVKAKEEITAVLETSRRALADLRAVSRKYRDMSFAAEIDSVVSLLSAAGVHVQSDASLAGLESDTETVLATVLREAVANVLRHSSVQNCRIDARHAAGSVMLRIVNDGVGPEDPSPISGDSSGLSNLSQRVSAIGGTLDAGVQPDGRFQLVAEVPACVAAPPRV